MLLVIDAGNHQAIARGAREQGLQRRVLVQLVAQMVRGDIGVGEGAVGGQPALVVEPGGAIGLAAMLAGKVDIKGKVVIGVLSGGNTDPELFHRLIAA